MSHPDVAAAIRTVTAKLQTELDRGRRSRRIDADDLLEALLAIADALDPPFEDGSPDATGWEFCRHAANRPEEGLTCPYCRHVWSSRA